MTTIGNPQLKERLTQVGLEVVPWRLKRMYIGAPHPVRDIRIGGTPRTIEQITGGTGFHHGASRNATTPLQIETITREWFDLHVITNRWRDLFYGAVIGEGCVAVGRGLRYSTGQDVATLCVPGDYRLRDLTDDQKTTARLVIAVYQSFGVPTRIRGHNQITADSECPGRYGLDFVASLPQTGLGLPAIPGQPPGPLTLEQRVDRLEDEVFGYE